MGKATTIYAVNGTEILLPCTFSSCFGFENLRFWWTYNSTDTFRLVSGVGTVRTVQILLPFSIPHLPSQTVVHSGLSPTEMASKAQLLLPFPPVFLPDRLWVGGMCRWWDQNLGSVG